MQNRRMPSTPDKIDYIIKVIADTLNELSVPKYSSKFSNKVYDDHLKICLLVLKQYLNKSYRELCSELRSLSIWERGYALDHSTLVKFSKKIDVDLLDKILAKIAHMKCEKDMTVAVDATGFSCSDASLHYVKRLKEFKNNIGYEERAIRRYSKLSLAVDTDSKMILACDSVDSTHADVKRMTYIVDKLARGNFSISYVVADKGYDAEYVHVEIKDRLKAKTAIPARDMAESIKNNGIRKTRGRNRSRMKREFQIKDSEVSRAYKRRSQVETVNSMIKRKMGGAVRCRSEFTRRIEISFRCIAHNLNRLIALKCI